MFPQNHSAGHCLSTKNDLHEARPFVCTGLVKMVRHHRRLGDLLPPSFSPVAPLFLATPLLWSACNECLELAKNGQDLLRNSPNIMLPSHTRQKQLVWLRTFNNKTRNRPFERAHLTLRETVCGFQGEPSAPPAAAPPPLQRPGRPAEPGTVWRKKTTTPKTVRGTA